MKPDYSDFYKFIVSVGLLLVSLSFLGPWLVFQASFQAEIPAAKLNSLTAMGRQLVQAQQRAGLVFSNNAGWMSMTSGLAGIGILAFGLWKWRDKQASLDRKENLEARRSELEIRPLNATQIAEKSLEQLGILLPLAQSQQEGGPPGANLLLAKYLYCQRIAGEKIKEALGGHPFRLLENRQIGDLKYDLIVVGEHAFEGNDALVQVRYSGKVPEDDWIREEVGRTVVLLETYKRTRSHCNISASLVIIAPAAYSSRVPSKELLSKLDVSAFGQQMELCTVPEERLQSLGPQDAASFLPSSIQLLLHRSLAEARAEANPFVKYTIVAFLTAFLGALGAFTWSSVIGSLVAASSLVALVLLYSAARSWRKFGLMLFECRGADQLASVELTGLNNTAKVPRKFLRAHPEFSLDGVSVKIYGTDNQGRRAQLVLNSKRSNIRLDADAYTPVSINESVLVRLLI